MSRVGHRTPRDGEMAGTLQQEQGSSGGPGRRVIWPELTGQGVLGPTDMELGVEVGGG